MDFNHLLSFKMDVSYWIIGIAIAFDADLLTNIIIMPLLFSAELSNPLVHVKHMVNIHRWYPLLLLFYLFIFSFVVHEPV